MNAEQYMEAELEKQRIHKYVRLERFLGQTFIHIKRGEEKPIVFDVTNMPFEAAKIRCEQLEELIKSLTGVEENQFCDVCRFQICVDRPANKEVICTRCKDFARAQL